MARTWIAAALYFASAACGPAGMVAGSPGAMSGDDRDGPPERDDGSRDTTDMPSDDGLKVERCGNGVDDDLDGQVDDGCTCVEGEYNPCWVGPRAAQDRGICRGGRQACEQDSSARWHWGPCENMQLPEPEACDDGEDDDCDGRPDCDDTDCASACGGGCAGEELSCRDGIDDDCDGAVDCEDPECAPGCDGGGDGGGDGEDVNDDGGDDGEEPPDDCADGEWECGDDRDDDCDGAVDCADDDCACAGDEERCNGWDDDGDGRVDEGRACGQADDGHGECIPRALRICDAYCGVHQECGDDGWWGPCIVDALCAGVASCAEHADCPRGDWCDFGWCVPGTVDGWACDDDWQCGGGWCAFEQGVCVVDCLHHGDCGEGLVCDLGYCVADPYVPGSC